MNYAEKFVCIECGKEMEFQPDKIEYLCPACRGNLEIRYDYAAISKKLTRETLAADRDRSLWRYRALYPIDESTRVTPLQVGWTPLLDASRFAKLLGISKLLLKDDGRNPSGSLKDRAGSIALSVACERGMTDKLTGASTGNAGSSMACLAASIGASPIIFVPARAPKAKVAQLLIYGAKVITVNGTYDNAFDLCLEFSQKYGYFNRNTGYNPYTREGKKSVSFEICEQNGWKVPDWVAVSVGDGNIISGVWKGFQDLKRVGLIDRLPKLCAVQSSKSNSIAKSFKMMHDGKIEVLPVNATTIADSISVDLPRDGYAAVKAIAESGGVAVEVEDEEILDAITLLARNSGIFAEPAGATPIAGIKKMATEKRFNEGETVTAIITGNGLKDIDSALKAAGKPALIEPDLKEVAKVLNL